MSVCLWFGAGLLLQAMRQEGVGPVQTAGLDGRFAMLALILLRVRRERMAGVILAWTLGCSAPSFEPIGRWWLTVGIAAACSLPLRRWVRVGHPFAVLGVTLTLMLAWDLAGVWGRTWAHDTPRLAGLTWWSEPLVAWILQALLWGSGVLWPGAPWRAEPSDTPFLREARLGPRSGGRRR